MTVAYDLLSSEHFAAPYETYALMRENDPLYWHEQMDMWFAARYQDVGKDQIDIIADFGFPVPSRVIAHMLGVAPERVNGFEHWSHDITRMPSLLEDPGQRAEPLVGWVVRGVTSLPVNVG